MALGGGRRSDRVRHGSDGVVERGTGVSADSRLDSLFVTPRSRTRSVAPIALALCLAVLASCGSAAAPAATLGTAELTDAQLAHEEDIFGFLAGLNQQPCGTADGDETTEAACARFALTKLIQEHFVAGSTRGRTTSR